MKDAIAVAGGWHELADLLDESWGAIVNYRALSSTLTPEQRARVIAAVVDLIADDPVDY